MAPTAPDSRDRTSISSLPADAEDIFDKTGRISLDAPASRALIEAERSLRRYRRLLVIVSAVALFSMGGIVWKLVPTGTGSSVGTGLALLSPAFPESVPKAPASIVKYGPELLDAMNRRFNELGLGTFSYEELAALRDQGLTATFLGQMIELGYTDLDIPMALRLSKADVSARFVAMMQELGYSLTYEDLIRLRQNDVTANLTGKLADGGLPGLSIDELIRARTIGVDETTLARFRAVNGRAPSFVELIRFQISNQ